MSSDKKIHIGDMIDEAQRLNKGLIDIAGMVSTAVEVGGDEVTEDAIFALKELAGLIEMKLDAARSSIDAA